MFLLSSQRSRSCGRLRKRWVAVAASLCLLSALGACGGGGGGTAASGSPSTAGIDPFFLQTSSGGATEPANGSVDTSSTGLPGGAANTLPGNSNNQPISREEAMRFLQQASFGATEADIARVQELGIEGWIDWQLSLPLGPTTLDYTKQAYLHNYHPATKSVRTEVGQAFWRQALTAQDQLRWRVAYALSQILVVSVGSGGFAGFNAPAVADYFDLLAREGFGSYRNLLGKVTYHPAMGIFLNALGNRKEDTLTGRVPDENYAREILQLFTIGTVALTDGGIPVMDGSGAPVELYTPDDISGLAKVFTGFGLDCFTAYEFPFRQTCGYHAVVRPMMLYAGYHSSAEKSFLGLTIPAQSSPQPEASVNAALDHLVKHPNVAPFVVRQLIQRLVLSNPSPRYVRDVVTVWRATQGNLGLVVRAILLHREARERKVQDDPTRWGRVREPALHLSQLLRAFEAKSASGLYLLSSVSDGLSMSPLSAPSVFNFYRPGFKAPASQTALNQLVAPELQIVGESQVSAWVALLRQGLTWGLGAPNRASTDPRSRDVWFDLAQPANDLADNSAALLDWVSQRLLSTPLSDAVKADIVAALDGIPLQTNKGVLIPEARLNRVRACILLVASTPEYKVEQ